MKEFQHFINGAFVTGSSGRFGDVFNPATRAVQATAPLASRAASWKRSSVPNSLANASPIQ